MTKTIDRMTRLRANFHRNVCGGALFIKKTGRREVASIADVSSELSRRISTEMIRQVGFPLSKRTIPGQTAGARFEVAVRSFLEASLETLGHMRPAKWVYTVHGDISQFAQYSHLAELGRIIKENKALRTALGDYVVQPDVVVARQPVDDSEINKHETVVGPQGHPRLTPIRRKGKEDALILHASISCKLTLRSDRSQNARTEGLNLIRQRKGHSPHIGVVTAEPLPSRIASLALGTGDIDCVYHMGLDELQNAVQLSGDESALDSLMTMIQGDRLRDIVDLPFDLIT